MRKKIIPLFALLTAAAFTASLFIGRYSIVPADLLQPDTMSCKIFFTLRLPRTIIALIAGAGLALAGYVYQTIFSNPVAAPDIIGVSSGASAGAACMILLAGSHTILTALGSMAGGFLAVLLTITLARFSKSERINAFLLAGIAVNALAQSTLMTMKRTADPEKELASIEYWIMGSLSSVTLEQAVPVIPLVLAGMIPLLLLSKTITLLSLPGDEAQMLGVPVRKMRRLIILLSTLIVTAITSITGLISFVGLLGPHIARLLRRSNDRGTMILTLLCGSTLVLIADCLARSIGSSEIPISILTSLLGAPYLIWLLLKGGDRT